MGVKYTFMWLSGLLPGCVVETLVKGCIFTAGFVTVFMDLARLIEEAVRGNKGVAEGEHKCTVKDWKDTVEGGYQSKHLCVYSDEQSARTGLKV